MEHKEEEMSMAMEIVREYKKRENRRCIFDLVKTLVFCAAFCFVVVNAYFPNTASTPVAQLAQFLLRLQLAGKRLAVQPRLLPRPR